MKKISLLLLCVLLSNCYTQKTIQKQETVNKPLTIETIESSETYPFNDLKIIPVSPSCKRDLDLTDLKKCVSKSITMHINRKFNAGLGAKYPKKKYTINVDFIISKEGKVININASGSGYSELDNEAKRTINLLPKFTPGMIKGKKVNTKYSLPISFYIG